MMDDLTKSEQRFFDTYTSKAPVVMAGFPDAHQVFLSVGVQKFNINDACEDADAADWMRKMLAKALSSVAAKTTEVLK